MPSDESAKPGLEAYGRAFRQAQLRPEADAQIRRRLEQERVPVPGAQRLRSWYWVAAALASVTLLVISQLGQKQLPASCAVETEGRTSWFRGACQLDLWALSVSMGPTATLVQTDARVELVTGRASFSVQKVPRGQPPVTVYVPGGRIEVLGTRFEVELAETAGEVVLEEGSIRFVSDDRPAVVMRPGERFVWRWEQRRPGTSPLSRPSNAPEANTAPGSTSGPRLVPQPELPSSMSQHQPSTPQPSVPAASGPRAGRTANAPVTSSNPTSALERMMELKMQGKFGQALQVLDEAASAGVDARTAEVLSFERGALLEKLDPARACAQFALHEQRFGGGRYARALSQRRRHCPVGTNEKRTAP